MVLTRGNFVKQAGLMLGFSVTGSSILLTAAQAHTKDIPFNVLRSEKVSTLESIAECLLPGAKEAGAAHFVDQQLGIDANDYLLMLKYFNYPPPYRDFYRAALREMNKLSYVLFGDDVDQLNQTNIRELVTLIRGDIPDVRDGPPAALVYHAFRNDAVEGFKKPGIPYMEHILPPEG